MCLRSAVVEECKFSFLVAEKKETAENSFVVGMQKLSREAGSW